MGLVDSFGALVVSIVASLVLFAFAIVSFFTTVFVVQVGAGPAGYSASGELVVPSASIIAAGAVVAGATPMSSLGETTE